MILVLTCEHGGNTIPDNYKKYVAGKAVLETHRAYDLGALSIFKNLKPLAHVSHFSKTSRLLVELNRSLHHKNLFSEFTKDLPKIEKADIINRFYSPYRTAVESAIRNYIKKGNLVLHLSIHSFTPNLNGNERHCDIGLLYDSKKQQEKVFCKTFKTAILKENPNLNIRYNYPYLGKADGFTTYLRKQFPENYMGIELEINQKFVINNVMDSEITAIIYNAISQLKSEIQN